MINYDNVRGGVTVSTEPGPKTHSRLIINQATRADSGNYTCRASNTEADTIYVFVSKGDNTAAIQRQESGASEALRRPGSVGGRRLAAVLAAALLAATAAVTPAAVLRSLWDGAR
ncbi:Uncharacterized protein GBIM_04107 [Gryllus bimaculatus]|nr:Uncharacterized protein GBIM_04107 [Gryllus bimaculatus]